MSDFDLEDIRQLLPAFLAKQRWFSGGEPDNVEIEQDEHGAPLTIKRGLPMGAYGLDPVELFLA